MDDREEELFKSQGEDFEIAYGEVLIKADKDDKDIIYIEASNEKVDTQNDKVLMKALEDEAEAYLKKGVISYDHLHTIEKNPKYIIGEPLDVRFTDRNTTLVKGKLYRKNEFAKGILDNLESGSSRFGASIGGFILAKSKYFDKALCKSVPVVEKIMWRDTAVTSKPINEYTLGSATRKPYKEFLKSFVFMTEEIQKALTAGSGVNAESFTGGRSLVGEDLMGANKDVYSQVIANIIDGKIMSYKDLKYYLSNTVPGITDTGINIVASTIAQNRAKLLGMI